VSSWAVVVEDYLRPAAIRAEVLKLMSGKIYIDCDFVKRFGFHTFRHSLTSWLMANGENPRIVRAMLRWTNLNMLATTPMASKPTSLRLRVRC
jgi:integrase